MSTEKPKSHNPVILVSLAVNVAAAFYFVVGGQRADLRCVATTSNLQPVPPALAGSQRDDASPARSYNHIDSLRLQTPAMRKAMVDSCPRDRQIEAITDATSYNAFIVSVFDALNKVTTRNERALYWVLDRYEDVWGNRTVGGQSDGRGALPHGFYAEFGVFTGNTLKYAHSKLKRPSPVAHLVGPLAGFDSFQGLPEKWRGGFDAGMFGGHGLYEKVRASVPQDVELHKGWFQETIDKFLAAYPNTPASLIHHDGDLFISTAITFSMLDRRIVPGTLICFDELHSYPEWEKHEMLAFYLWMIHSKATMCAVSTKEPIKYTVEGGVVKQDMEGQRELHWNQQSSCFQVLDRGTE